MSAYSEQGVRFRQSIQNSRQDGPARSLAGVIFHDVLSALMVKPDTACPIEIVSVTSMFSVSTIVVSSSMVVPDEYEALFK